MKKNSLKLKGSNLKKKLVLISAVIYTYLSIIFVSFMSLCSLSSEIQTGEILALINYLDVKNIVRTSTK